MLISHVAEESFKEARKHTHSIKRITALLEGQALKTKEMAELRLPV